MIPFNSRHWNRPRFCPQMNCLDRITERMFWQDIRVLRTMFRTLMNRSLNLGQQP